MRMKIAIITLVLVTLGLTSAFAGNSTRTGTAGAQELLIPVGARGMAMGGSVVANAPGIEAIVWNPAGLGFVEGTEAMFTHLEYMADIDLDYAAIGTNIEDFGTIAISAKVISIGEMEETTEEQPDGTGRIFSPTMSILGVSYGRVLTANVAFGATFKLIREDIFEVSATGVAVDVGFTYTPNWHGVALGFAINNYGPEMSFSGRGFEYTLGDRLASPNAAPFDLPSSIDMGISVDAVNDGPHYAVATGNFRSNNYYQDLFQLGSEYSYDDMAFLRAGFNFADDEEWLYGLSAGAGLKFDVGGDTDITLEYTWRDVDVFEADHFFTVKAAF